MDTRLTQQLIERIASLLRSESRSLLLEYGLQPIQFEALQYLAACNRYSDMPMAVTEFLGQTKGTVSQTLKVLEKKGLLSKRPDTKDKRITHLKITDQGRELVDKLLPTAVLQTTSKHLEDIESEDINRSLTTLLTQLQQANNYKTFGQCSTCQHNIRKISGEYLCDLTQETLSKNDISLICREHQPQIGQRI